MPWLRAPLPSPRLVEDLLTTLSGHGFSDEQVVDTYRAFTSFLVGQLHVNTEAPGKDSAAVVDRSIDLSTRPSIERMRSLLRKDPATEDFEKSLQALLERVPRRLTRTDGVVGGRGPGGTVDHHCDNPSSSRSNNVSSPASNSSRL